jgi:hypothetical protein
MDCIKNVKQVLVIFVGNLEILKKDKHPIYVNLVMVQEKLIILNALTVKNHLKVDKNKFSDLVIY